MNYIVIIYARTKSNLIKIHSSLLTFDSMILKISSYATMRLTGRSIIILSANLEYRNYQPRINVHLEPVSNDSLTSFNFKPHNTEQPSITKAA